MSHKFETYLVQKEAMRTEYNSYLATQCIISKEKKNICAFRICLKFIYPSPKKELTKILALSKLFRRELGPIIHSKTRNIFLLPSKILSKSWLGILRVKQKYQNGLYFNKINFLFGFLCICFAILTYTENVIILYMLDYGL